MRYKAPRRGWHATSLANVRAPIRPVLEKILILLHPVDMEFD